MSDNQPQVGTSDDAGAFDWCPDCGTVHGSNEDCPPQPTPAEPRIETVQVEEMIERLHEGEHTPEDLREIAACLRAWAGSSLKPEPTVEDGLRIMRKIEMCTSDATKLLVLKGFIQRCIAEHIGERASPPSSPGAARTVKKLCGHEFKLKDGYFCELPHGHAGGHEATCPNPQFHQSWPNETADMCNKCQDEHEGFLDECECKCHHSPGAPQEQK